MSCEFCSFVCLPDAFQSTHVVLDSSVFFCCCVVNGWRCAQGAHSFLHAFAIANKAQVIRSIISIACVLFVINGRKSQCIRLCVCDSMVFSLTIFQHVFSFVRRSSDVPSTRPVFNELICTHTHPKISKLFFCFWFVRLLTCSHFGVRVLNGWASTLPDIELTCVRTWRVRRRRRRASVCFAER